MRQAAHKVGRITIGQAVADLKAEFPDADIKESKIRHLENEGLIAPERTPSGYRILRGGQENWLNHRAQREHYLPLRCQGHPTRSPRLGHRGERSHASRVHYGTRHRGWSSC